MNMTSVKLPLWLRFVLIAGLVVLAGGAGLLAYRYYTKPVTLTVAVGSIDGEAANAMSAIASKLVSINAPVRLTIVDTGTALAAGKTFAAGKTDLAVVRGDVGDLSQAQAVVVVSHIVALVIAPPDSPIDSISKLKGRSVGVIGLETNVKLVEVLSKEYGLDGAKVFRDVALTDVHNALQSKQISALLVVIPLSQKYLSLVRGFFQQGPKILPVLITIDSAGAIAQSERAYESYDIPKGTLRGAPPVPSDDLTSLRVSYFLVANKSVSANDITDLAQSLVDVRRDLLSQYPILAQSAAPSTDANALIPIHPGAATYYNGNQQSFLDKYDDKLYYGSLLLGSLISIIIAAWRFAGSGNTPQSMLEPLYEVGNEIRGAKSEAQLEEIEKRIDDILKSELARNANGEGADSPEMAALSLTAHRLQYLMSH